MGLGQHGLPSPSQKTPHPNRLGQAGINPEIFHIPHACPTPTPQPLGRPDLPHKLCLAQGNSKQGVQKRWLATMKGRGSNSSDPGDNDPEGKEDQLEVWWSWKGFPLLLKCLQEYEIGWLSSCPTLFPAAPSTTWPGSGLCTACLPSPRPCSSPNSRQSYLFWKSGPKPPAPGRWGPEELKYPLHLHLAETFSLCPGRQPGPTCDADSPASSGV